MLEQQPKEPVAIGFHLALLGVNNITPAHNIEEKIGPKEGKPDTTKSIGVLQPTSMGAEFGPQGIHID